MHPMAGYCALHGLTPLMYMGARSREFSRLNGDTGIRIRDMTIKKIPVHLACLNHGFDWHMVTAAQIDHYDEIAWEEVSVVYLDRLATALVDALVRHNNEKR